MNQYLSLLLKGMALGTANVIPGVSGGTIALITGIFQRLINAIKSFNLKAVSLLFSGKWKAFVKHTDLYFLLALMSGILLAVISLAKIFDYLFTNYPTFIWAYFFGLILASVFYVGKRVEKWNVSTIIPLLLGIGIAATFTFVNPATENTSFLYLMICGVVAICSMILPGLSGSFVLILLGNYKLIMIDAINQLRIDILLPVAIGAGVGLIAFSHFLSWILKKYFSQTIALLTGFIVGSLSILWPWKTEMYLMNDIGEIILKKGEKVVTGYQYNIPNQLDMNLLIAIGLIGLGILSIVIIERLSVAKSEEK